VITEVKLENFKCFEALTLELGPLSLLTGVNGSGKTSAIQSLLVLRQSWAQGLLQQGLLALNGDQVQLGTAKDLFYENAQSEQIGIRLTSEDGAQDEWSFGYDKEADVLAARSTPSEVSAGIRRSLLGDECQYLCAERLGPRASFPISDFAVREHRQLGTKGEFAAHYLTQYGSEKLQHDLLAHPSSASLALKDQVEAWLGTVSPGARISLTKHPGLDLMQVEFSFAAGRDVTGRHRPTHVGFGLTYSLPILVAILGAKPGAVILLENPEAHLHPKGQAEFGRLLALAAASGIQVIVESHSDHVLNGVRLAIHDGEIEPEAVRIKFFARGGDGAGLEHSVRSPSIDSDGRIDYWPDDFFDQYERSLEALLIPRGQGK
jgi:predicted ATPase